LYGNEVILNLCEWYGIKALDEAGWKSFKNSSCEVRGNIIWYLLASKDELFPKVFLATYAIADEMTADLGYGDRSQITSEDIEKKILELRGMSPDQLVNYVKGLYSKVDAMTDSQVNNIANYVRWTGFVDKKPDAAYPADISKLLDPSGTLGSISPDDLPPMQGWFLLPR
jgi:hypothetical protein